MEDSKGRHGKPAGIAGSQQGAQGRAFEEPGRRPRALSGDTVYVKSDALRAGASVMGRPMPHPGLIDPLPPSDAPYPVPVSADTIYVNPRQVGAAVRMPRTGSSARPKKQRWSSAKAEAAAERSMKEAALQAGPAVTLALPGDIRHDSSSPQQMGVSNSHGPSPLLPGGVAGSIAPVLQALPTPAPHVARPIGLSARPSIPGSEPLGSNRAATARLPEGAAATAAPVGGPTSVAATRSPAVAVPQGSSRAVAGAAPLGSVRIPLVGGGLIHNPVGLMGAPVGFRGGAGGTRLNGGVRYERRSGVPLGGVPRLRSFGPHP